MSVYRTVTLEWGEETFEFTPSFSLLERVENIIPMSQLAMDLQGGRMKSTIATRLLYTVAKSAGADVNIDEVHQVMSNLPPQERLDVLVSIIDAFSPKAPEGKKPTARLQVGPKE